MDNPITQKLGPFTEYLECIKYQRSLRSGSVVSGRTLKVAVLAGSTSAHMIGVLDAFLLSQGLNAEFWDSGYDLYEHAVLAPDPKLTEFNPDVILFFVGTENIRYWPGSSDSPADIVTKLERECERWECLIEKCAESFDGAVIFPRFEKPNVRSHGNFSTGEKTSNTRFVEDLNRAILDKCCGQAYFIDVDYLSAQVGMGTWKNMVRWNMSKHAIDLPALPYYAYNVSRLICGLLGMSKKCLVLDLDNTLWGGVVGEDGIDGIKIGQGDPEGEAFVAFQRYVLGLHERGVLLAVCSKNDEDLARSVFTENANMLLQLDHMSCFMANWDDKATNIRKIAQQLNIGLDSLVFFDDSKAEQALVTAMLPDVQTVDVPEDCSNYVKVLDELCLFDTPNLSKEDIARAAMYRAEEERKKTQSSFSSYEDYLQSLEMTAIIGPFDAQHLPRIAQLVARTNQFNLTTQRYSEKNLAEMIADHNRFTRYVSLADRFGDSGLISALSGIIDGNNMTIDLWVMSCRVFCRGIEKALMNNVCECMRDMGVSRIIGEYRPTERNNIVRDLYETLGFRKESTNDECTQWAISVQEYQDQSASILVRSE